MLRFYGNENDFLRFHQGLKLKACPHCKSSGTLILNGKLYGYTENDDNRKSCHGRRVFCNNRKKRNKGCGLTFSVSAAQKLRRLRLGANMLWAFFKLVIGLGNTAQALRSLNVDFSISSAYRIWKRFVNCQSHIRTALNGFGPAPERPHSRQPLEQTLAHLESAFPGEPCPIEAFQQQLQLGFFCAAPQL